MIRWLAVVAALALQQPGASPVRVVLDTNVEALWDLDGAAGLDAEIVSCFACDVRDHRRQRSAGGTARARDGKLT